MTLGALAVTSNASSATGAGTPLAHTVACRTTIGGASPALAAARAPVMTGRASTGRLR